MSNIFFKEMQRLKKEMDTAFNKFLDAPKLLPKLYPGKDVELFHSPMNDVVEREKDVLVMTSMPGFSKNDITLKVKNGMLEIFGERNSADEENKKGYFTKERSYNGLHKVMQLPTKVKVENANIKYDNGILTVTLPKEHPGFKKLGYKLQ